MEPAPTGAHSFFDAPEAMVAERRNVDHRSEDPTDISTLLAGLRDPGPVPSDLMDRINASLATERLHRSTVGDDPAPTAAMRRSWLLPAAAAGVLALGGAGAILATSVGSRVPAGPTASGVAASLSTTQTRFRHTDSGRQYAWSTLTTQVRDQWAGQSTDPAERGGVTQSRTASLFSAPGAQGVATVSAIDTLADAQRCLAQLGQSVRGSVWVDDGRMGTRDVTVIATGSDRSGWSVAVVKRAACAPLGAVRQVPPAP